MQYFTIIIQNQSIYIKIIMKAIKFILYIILLFIIYIAAAYISRQAITYYSAKEDSKIDYFLEYSNTTIKDHYKIVFIITAEGATADREAGFRMIEACNNLGWEVHVFEELTNNQDKIEEINPDFILTNNWRSDIGLRYVNLPYKTYGLVAHPIASYFAGFFSFTPQFKEHKYPEFKLFDGFIVSTPEISLFKKYIESKNKRFYGFKGYSSSQSQPYVEVEPKEIVYMGSNWDKKRKGDKFNKIFKAIAEKGQAVFYGPASSWEKLGNAYKGFFKGSSSAVVDIIREHGISLMLHSNQHIKSGTPSSRVFETSSSGALGIGDMHPFLIDNFGDNFLYIDTDKSADNIIKQIDQHLKWAKENPDKVKTMTQNAHDIFMNKFTLEQMILDVAHMHEKIILDEATK